LLNRAEFLRLSLWCGFWWLHISSSLCGPVPINVKGTTVDWHTFPFPPGWKKLLLIKSNLKCIICPWEEKKGYSIFKLSASLTRKNWF
jgi:hypothetical protein